MARIIVNENKGPAKVEIGGEIKHMCMCGLSKKKPFCDGSHHKTKEEEEGKVYKYDGEGNREEIK
jgi:CDGSH-type Zn-finger protein